jgi:hypothetical protein
MHPPETSGDFNEALPGREMRIYSLALISAFSGVVFVPASAVAHHSAAEYDRTKTITVQATVVEFRYVNPHPQLFVDAKDENGNLVHWDVEIGPNPAELLRIGWGKKRSNAALAPGSVITVTIAPSKLSALHGVAQKIITADGEHVFGAAVRFEN